MKRCLILFSAVAGLFALFVFGGRASEKKKVDPASVYGRIQFVKAFPDYKVKAVSAFPDVKIKIVKSQPGAGEWEIVDSFADYKIEMVKTFPDFTVEFINGLPEGAK